MKSTLTLCTILLGGSMFVVAQQPATSPTTSTPPTFPTDQKAPDRPQQNLPPDTSAGQKTIESTTVDQNSVAPKTIEGCLSQSNAGNGFILTDASGTRYNVQGDSSQISSHLGQQVNITGQVTNITASSTISKTDNPDSKSNTAVTTPDAHSSTANESVINMTKLDKVADSCTNPQAPSSK